MKKILIPVDFSEHTEITCSYALEIAKAIPSEIMLFPTYFDQRVLTDTSFPDTMNMSAVYNEELIQELHRQAEESMKTLDERFRKQAAEAGLPEQPIRTQVTGGDIEMELRQVCSEYHPDLLIMGTRGKGRNVHVWGRVSTYIINHARVPVMTIPEIKQFMGFGYVMFAADLSESNEQSIRKAIELLQPFLQRLFVVHFLTGKGEEAERMENLRQSFASEEKKGLVQFLLQDPGEDNQKSLEAFISTNGIEVVAFQPKKHHLLYSLFTRNITKKELFSTNIPLLAIPESV